MKTRTVHGREAPDLQYLLGPGRQEVRGLSQSQNELGYSANSPPSTGCRGGEQRLLPAQPALAQESATRSGRDSTRWSGSSETHNGAYVGGDAASGSSANGLVGYTFQTKTFYSKHNNERYMIHKPLGVDEEVWLNRDGVAKGEDAVVNRALVLITSLAHTHDVNVGRN